MLRRKEPNMNRTRSFLLVKGLLATLVCGSNCFAQGWAPIRVASDGSTLQAPIQPVQAVGTVVTLPVDQPKSQPTPPPVAAPANLLEMAPVTQPIVPPAFQPTAPATFQPTAPATSQPTAPATAPPTAPATSQPTAPATAPPANKQPWPPEFLEQLPHPPDHPTSLLQPATAQQYTCPSSAIPTRYFEADPLLAPANGSGLGWYTSLELQYAFPHIYKDLSNSVVAGSRAPDMVDLPNRGLDGTVAPRIEVGYKLPEAFGSIALSYRFLGTSGSAQTFGPDGLANLQSRMDLNIMDLDYVSQQLLNSEHWSMRWRVGARLAYLYYDSVLNQSLDEAAAGTGILQQHATNSYWGIGPHATLEMTHSLGVQGLSLLGRIDFASIVGRIKQGVSESALDAASPIGVSFGQNIVSSSQTVPMTSLLLGLTWLPAGWENVEFFAGYEYEYWWNVGRESSLANSSGEMQIQGFIARFQICY